MRGADVGKLDWLSEKDFDDMTMSVTDLVEKGDKHLKPLQKKIGGSEQAIAKAS